MASVLARTGGTNGLTSIVLCVHHKIITWRRTSKCYLQYTCLPNITRKCFARFTTTTLHRLFQTCSKKFVLDDTFPEKITFSQTYFLLYLSSIQYYRPCWLLKWGCVLGKFCRRLKSHINNYYSGLTFYLVFIMSGMIRICTGWSFIRSKLFFISVPRLSLPVSEWHSVRPAASRLHKLVRCGLSAIFSGIEFSQQKHQ